MKKALAGRWDIDWRKLGHVEPKVKSVKEPKFGAGTAPIAVSVAKPKTAHSPPAPTVEQVAVAIAKPVETRVRTVPAEPKIISVTKPQKPKLPAPAVKPKAMNIINEQINDCEVKEMDTNTVTKDRPANQGRFAERTTTDIGNGRREEKVSKIRETIRNERPDVNRKRGRDVSSGMDLLDLDFMLDMVENVETSEPTDIQMRKLIFAEILRTERLHELDSSALKAYAVNEGGLFEKDVQCEAMKELTERTIHNRH